MRIAIYTRVSTDEQTTENQLSQLRAFAASQSWSIVAEFTDSITGGTSDRPGFNAMFQAAERGEFDTLLFWSLDRLSREGTLITLQHLDRLRKLGIGYKAMQEQFLDTTNPYNDVFVALAATKAREEKQRISERTKAGLARVRAAGTVLGRPSKIDAQSVRSLRTSGKTQSQVAALLSISIDSVRRLERQAA
jgi:DNA invertase Pin-like site-specific DNA recombinase